VKSDYSKGLAKFFKEGFTKGGGQIVAELDYNGGDKDFKGQLTAIKSANPEGSSFQAITRMRRSSASRPRKSALPYRSSVATAGKAISSRKSARNP
jgi:ABC-type branched-subunit amino acid transport system substrate-binding protein